MRGRFVNQAVLATLLLYQFSLCLATETTDANDSTKYLDAVREFADNVLKYGRDTYGPKHTPLFVDGLNIHTHEPVKWIAPNGDRWILSNLASQQNLFRVLDALTTITGDPKYRQAAMDAIRYAFDNLRSPNGLLYWGEYSAYDAQGDIVCGSIYRHILKSFYPYYDLMWEVDSKATERFIESFWAAHIVDWSNLEMDRIGPLNKPLVAKKWVHEYKGGSVFFESPKRSFDTAASDLYYGAAILTSLSGKREPLIWATRLAHRYIETRDSKTGISCYTFTLPSDQPEHPLANDFKGRMVHDGNIFCVSVWNDQFIRRHRVHSITFSPGVVGNISFAPWICQLLLGEMLGDPGKEFQQWALEELTAWGKVAYRRADNSWIPMLTDGTSLEGYICKTDSHIGPKGMVFEAGKPSFIDLWAYALAYEITDDAFMWYMARDITLANNLGDIGTSLEEDTRLNMITDCDNAHALLGFLSLYKKTQEKPFLDMADKIGGNIVDHKCHRGLFLPSNRHIYAKLDVLEPLVLLHLYTVVRQEYHSLPTVWPTRVYFSAPYRRKERAWDSAEIYTLTDSSESPTSLNEAAAMGGVSLVKSLIVEGCDVNNRGYRLRVPLHHATINNHKEVVELLIVKGADIGTGDSLGNTPLHYAAQKGHKEITELLIDKGADINAKNLAGERSLHYAVRDSRKDIAELLIEKGAVASSIYEAAYTGDIAKVKAFIQDGVDVNAAESRRWMPLNFAVSGGHKEVVELLIVHGAKVNPEGDRSPLHVAAAVGHADVVKLLIANGADVNAGGDRTPLNVAVKAGHTQLKPVTQAW
jgi:pectate lyase